MTLSIWILDTLQTLEFITTTVLTMVISNITSPTLLNIGGVVIPARHKNATLESDFKNSLNRRERYFSTESYYH